ncbi:MAG TPA: SUMF1/EgtB/PvdO family nonheme iron enzyme, partial [Pyrinomonadaceae bacterium]|nr:SUMF1/EgtB/PvdO family nonheme iron enzyme [Pyrinomonadaceae bacterium]
PSFQSMGVSVPPAIEAVVRHALEKEPAARIDSIDTFLQELNAAMNSTPFVGSLRETVAMDPNRTIASAVTTMNPPPAEAPGTTTKAPISPDTKFAASFELMDGTINGLDLSQEVQPPQPPEIPVAAPPAPARPEVEDPETTRVQQKVAPVVAPSQPSKPVRQTIDIGPQRRLSPLWIIGAAVLILIVAGLGVSGYLLFRANQQVTPGPGPTPTPTISSTIKADLIAIEGGSFLMGRNSGAPQETPAHPVAVLPFQMDRTEVTNTEYADFVREMEVTPPSHWVGDKPPFGQELWPVVNVDYNDALAFAAWRSKRDNVSYRLPTEEEWEFAARNGERADLYPWGPAWIENAAVVKEATPAPVGSRPEGKNRWGVVDLVGNVWEWTSSKTSVYPGSDGVVPDSIRDWITVRGGCYVSDPAKADAPVTACLRNFVPASTKNTLIGFRLVRNGP